VTSDNGTEPDRFTWTPGQIERRARADEIERRLMEGEVVMDSPEVTCAKVHHAWDEVVCHDGDHGPGYSRTCRRCGRAEISGPGHDWQPV
jgi:hypothetical protein